LAAIRRGTTRMKLTMLPSATPCDASLRITPGASTAKSGSTRAEQQRGGRGGTEAGLSLETK